MFLLRIRSLNTPLFSTLIFVHLLLSYSISSNVIPSFLHCRGKDNILSPSDQTSHTEGRILHTIATYIPQTCSSNITYPTFFSSHSTVAFTSLSEKELHPESHITSSFCTFLDDNFMVFIGNDVFFTAYTSHSHLLKPCV